MPGQQDQPALPDTVDPAREETVRALPGRGTDRAPGEAAHRSQPPADRRHLDRADQWPRHSVQEQLTERMWRLAPGHPSSPYDSHGRLRPPVPDVRERELPLPGEEDYNEADFGTEAHSTGGRDDNETPTGKAADTVSPAEAEEQPPLENALYRRDPAAGVGPDARQESAQSWRNALPSLRDLWQKHEENWPESERSPADRSQDEPGSWRGDSGHYLNNEENLVSDHAKARIGDVEKKVTPELLKIESMMPQAEVVGLQHKLKGEERFKEKVTEELRAKPDRSIAEISERMPDALRYTYSIGSSHYSDGYWTGRGMLQSRGCELLMSRNSWDDPEYKGINTRWLSPDGQVFEVQFHTPESFEAKQLTHKAYERLRSKTTDPAERPALEAFQREVCSYISIPDGVANIPDYRKEGY